MKAIPKSFSFSAEEMTIVPVWVKIHNWPMEHWNSKTLSKFATRLGSPDSTDGFTKEKLGISYVRILIHMDARKEFKEVITTKLPSGELRNLKLEYESKPKYCKHCLTLGHTRLGCTKSKQTDKLEAVTVLVPPLLLSRLRK